MKTFFGRLQNVLSLSSFLILAFVFWVSGGIFRTQWNIYDEILLQKRLKVVSYFRKNSIVDVWRGFKCFSGLRYLTNGLLVLKKVSYWCLCKVYEADLV